MTEVLNAQPTLPPLDGIYARLVFGPPTAPRVTLEATVVDIETGAHVARVRAYGTDLANRNSYVAIVLNPDAPPVTHPYRVTFEGFALFLDWVFTTAVPALRMVYLEWRADDDAFARIGLTRGLLTNVHPKPNHFIDQVDLMEATLWRQDWLAAPVREWWYRQLRKADIQLEGIPQ